MYSGPRKTAALTCSAAKSCSSLPSARRVCCDVGRPSQPTPLLESKRHAHAVRQPPSSAASCECGRPRPCFRGTRPQGQPKPMRRPPLLDLSFLIAMHSSRTMRHIVVAALHVTSGSPHQVPAWCRCMSNRPVLSASPTASFSPPAQPSLLPDPRAQPLLSQHEPPAVKPLHPAPGSTTGNSFCIAACCNSLPTSASPHLPFSLLIPHPVALTSHWYSPLFTPALSSTIQRLSGT